MKRLRSIAGMAVLLGLAACEVGPVAVAPEPQPRGFPGFDTAIYPGDAAMRAWRYPSSPYRWVGYYLHSPCHRRDSWMGRRAVLEQMGWGIAVIYVGQQLWEGVPSIQPSDGFGPDGAEAAVPTCSRVLLTEAQGRLEARDAADKTAGQGFPPGSVIYLDVERVSRIPPELYAYYRGWIAGVLEDGRFLPGTYAHRFNAPDLYAVAQAAYAAAGRRESPPYWIAGGSGFALERHPTEVGLPFASIWQGVLDVYRTWNGVRLFIDENVADRRYPSAPLR
jgi:hypothetical protein